MQKNYKLTPGYIIIFAMILNFSGFDFTALIQWSPNEAHAQEKQNPKHPSKNVIADKNEPGEPMIVKGTVFAPDGKTPVAGIKVYVYHTDAKGYYRKGTNSSQNPRLKGTMITDADGHYEYRTIKPGAYPGGGNPAHVHYVVSGKHYAEQYDELLSEGDRYLSESQRRHFNKEDTFGKVRPFKKDENGIWQCRKDIKLK